MQNFIIKHTHRALLWCTRFVVGVKKQLGLAKLNHLWRFYGHDKHDVSFTITRLRNVNWWIFFCKFTSYSNAADTLRMRMIIFRIMVRVDLQVALTKEVRVRQTFFGLFPNQRTGL